MGSEAIYKVIGWIVTVLAPFAIVLTAVRILLTPVWVHLEYRMPWFPEDPYGFTQADRLKWSLISLDYLLNDEGIEFLADTRFEDDVPIYNQRELGHMVDVKNVVTGALTLWWVSIALIILIGLLSRWGDWGDIFRVSLARGSWITIGLVGAILLFVVLAFGLFFRYFHEIFFPPGTWTFLNSDTLIRLFPMQFWQDAFLWVGGLAILISLWLISLVRNSQ